MATVNAIACIDDFIIETNLARFSPNLSVGTNLATILEVERGENDGMETDDIGIIKRRAGGLA